jgi:hypothetical protein
MFEDVIKVKESKIIIEKKHLACLWFENKNGDIIEWDYSDPYAD